MNPRLRALLFAGAGTAVAGLLAVILFVGIGTGQSPRVATQLTGGNIAPGINEPTGLLLSLTVLPPSSRKQAPDFTLTDQSGRPESPSLLRGKVLVVSANDDRCLDLCTLLANDIVTANQDLGPAARDVVWVSINANPYYPSVADVRAWTDEHGLGGQANWEFGTGSPAALARVWRSYGIVVQELPKTRTVNHSTDLYFVAPDGQERAVADFGTASASTSFFSHGLAQMADDLLPPSERVRVGGPEVPNPTQSNAAIGAVSPQFDLPYLKGGTGTFRSSSLDKGYAVVNFWSSTCTVCKEELPHIEAAYRQLGERVPFVGVDVADRRAPAEALARASHLSYPLVSDSQGVAASADRVVGLPFTMIVGPGGQILVRHPGDITAEQLVYVVESLDSDLPPPS